MEAEAPERARDRQRVLGRDRLVDLGRVRGIDGRHGGGIVAERDDPAAEDLRTAPARLRHAVGAERRRALEECERLFEAARARGRVGGTAEERGAHGGRPAVAREVEQGCRRTPRVAGGGEECEPHLRLGDDRVRRPLAEHPLVRRASALDVTRVGGEPPRDDVEPGVARRRSGGEERAGRRDVAYRGEDLGVLGARDRIVERVGTHRDEAAVRRDGIGGRGRGTRLDHVFAAGTTQEWTVRMRQHRAERAARVRIPMAQAQGRGLADAGVAGKGTVRVQAQEIRERGARLRSEAELQIRLAEKETAARGVGELGRLAQRALDCRGRGQPVARTRRGVEVGEVGREVERTRRVRRRQRARRPPALLPPGRHGFAKRTGVGVRIRVEHRPHERRAVHARHLRHRDGGRAFDPSPARVALRRFLPPGRSHQHRHHHHQPAPPNTVHPSHAESREQAICHAANVAARAFAAADEQTH